VRHKNKSGASRTDRAVDQLALDFNAPRQPEKSRAAEVVPISRHRASTVRDVLVGDLIASKVPKKK
jgi:hypothetical protein